MSESLYELIALAARYFFTLLMLLIVIRAWRITIVDSRRAANLRRWAPETGVIGEMQVLEGDEKARRGMVYPVIREGMIGRSRKADIRLRSRSVRLRHAYFEMTQGGLMLRSSGSFRIEGSEGRARHILLSDGGTVRIGKVLLLLVLNDASGAAAREQAEAEAEALFLSENEKTAVPEETADVRPEPEPDRETEAEDDYDRMLSGKASADEEADAVLYGENTPKKKNEEEEWWPHG